MTHEGKTLKELDVQAGDRVISVNNTFEEYGVFTCTGVVSSYGFWLGDRYLENDSYGRGLFKDADGLWVIVSRANDNDSNKIGEDNTMNNSNEIKVGDKVVTLNSEWGDSEYTVIHIHHVDPKRKYYVVAFMGDIPSSYLADQVRKVKPKVVGHSYTMLADPTGGDLYFGWCHSPGLKEVVVSYSTIDGVVDLGSYKITPA